MFFTWKLLLFMHVLILDWLSHRFQHFSPGLTILINSIFSRWPLSWSPSSCIYYDWDCTSILFLPQPCPCDIKLLLYMFLWFMWHLKCLSQALCIPMDALWGIFAWSRLAMWFHWYALEYLVMDNLVQPCNTGLFRWLCHTCTLLTIMIDYLTNR